MKNFLKTLSAIVSFMFTGLFPTNHKEVITDSQEPEEK